MDCQVTTAVLWQLAASISWSLPREFSHPSQEGDMLPAALSTEAFLQAGKITPTLLSSSLLIRGVLGY